MLQEKLPCYLLGPRSTRNNQLGQGSGGAVAGQTAGPYTHLLKVLLACDMQGVKKESIFFLFAECSMTLKFSITVQSKIWRCSSKLSRYIYIYILYPN